MPIKTYANLPTHFVDMGEGAEPAFLMHCSLAHSGAWSPVMERLRGAMTGRAVDMIGHGGSTNWTPDMGDVQDVATAICTEAAEDFAQGRRLHLIGHSFGATVAMRMALDAPDRVASLTLVEPVLFAAARAADPKDFDQRVIDTDAMIADIERGDRTKAASDFTDVWGAGLPWDALSASTRAYMEDRIHLIPAANDALFNDRGNVLGAGRLESLTMPTVLIEGAESPKVIGLIHDAFVGRLPDARRVVVQGAGHMVPISHPKAVAAEIDELLSLVRA